VTHHAVVGYRITEGIWFHNNHDVGLYSGFFRTERRCPECGRAMTINGRGTFKCRGCRYADWQDVSKLYAAGLDYPCPTRNKGALANYGKRKTRKNRHFN